MNVRFSKNVYTVYERTFFEGTYVFRYERTFMNVQTYVLIIKFLLTIKARRPICQNIYGQRKSMSLYLRATYISLAK